ncbi:MAG: tetratricopeptide repeat protein [Pyrinomonadaceae bacterium]
MKHLLKLILLLFAVSLAANAQVITELPTAGEPFAGFSESLPKPTAKASRATDSEELQLEDGQRLVREGKFDEGRKKYQDVLEKNASSVEAMYMIGASHYQQKNYSSALEWLKLAAGYDSPLLGEIYRYCGITLDDGKSPNEALKLYQRSLSIRKSHFVYFDRALTLYRLNRFDEARKDLKSSIDINSGYVNTHALLATLFFNQKYRVPAMLAAARLLSLTQGNRQSENAAVIINRVFAGNVKEGSKPNSISIGLSFDSPKDEGDFGAVELAIGLTAASSKVDEKDGVKKTPEQAFVDRFSKVVAILGEMEMEETFVKRHYIDFLTEAKRLGHLESLCYQILKESKNEEAAKWISSNGEKFIAFANWAKEFKAAK